MLYRVLAQRSAVFLVSHRTLSNAVTKPEFNMAAKETSTLPQSTSLPISGVSI